MSTPTPPPPPRRDQLSHAILGLGEDQAALTSTEVAAAAGVDEADARRLWRALGFPDAGGEAAFSEADAQALSLLVDAIGDEIVDLDTAVQLTRALGQTMGKLADWQIATLSTRVEELGHLQLGPDRLVEGALDLVERVGPTFEELLVYAWRRHLAVAVGRLEALHAPGSDLHVVEFTVGFADLVGFTALSNQLNQDEIGDLVEVFESRCTDVVASRRGRVIKSIGDSVLYVAEDPVTGVHIAEDIVQVIGRDKRLPDVRVGLASGPVTQRLGDVYGPPVNLAARLTAVARRNRVIVAPDTAAVLPGDLFSTQALPARPLRGFGVVEPVAVRRVR
ncbi:adenylate/guanylate cyclase domain-containing protein [Nocardioides massiliensis]|uniref:Adenylate cyclase n=1 Tax=Nocardioides massiliensis TaxID=1325935 RepID=A0ABT9NW28_9ACTN|nr:adenylate/guanylate cyclase domain-containing protein [Nocardioides massiliensis]MDP9824220.1 adenylate cyclase [Nocardioides massiliensis]